MKLRNKKTGEIVDFQPFYFYQTDSRKFPSKIYESLSDLNEEWEDYKPTEPLIKDEKIRKAVRAWAEASDVGVAKVAPFAVFDIESSARIYFYGRVIEDKDYDEKKSYTIDELCGEEEAPEPLEPTFVDLDERIKEKEEE